MVRRCRSDKPDAGHDLYYVIVKRGSHEECFLMFREQVSAKLCSGAASFRFPGYRSDGELAAATRELVSLEPDGGRHLHCAGDLLGKYTARKQLICLRNKSEW